MHPGSGCSCERREGGSAKERVREKRRREEGGDRKRGRASTESTGGIGAKTGGRAIPRKLEQYVVQMPPGGAARRKSYERCVLLAKYGSP